MKTAIFSFFLILSFVGLNQTFDLTVINGYGSGSYQSGDTVHVWSESFDNLHTFNIWSGSVSNLQNPREWHTKLIMPNEDVSITAEIAIIEPYIISNEMILAVNNNKQVYSCFPPSIKGIIYFFHGTGGNASNWIESTENRSIVNAAIADSFGIIITEAEEITLNTDLNGDGKLRWLTFPLDTLNGIDYLNLRAITDTFVNRGVILPEVPKFSIGMSNGGSFSAATSYIFEFDAGISYCASSAQAIFDVRSTPFGFRMALYDDNDQVGPQGNYEAWQNDSILNERGICHDYLIHENQPVYPERFARVAGISVSTSIAIFNELSSNNQLDNNNYALPTQTILSNIQATPLSYPVILSLNVNQQLEALNQIGASNAEHKFYSDYNFETLKFFNEICNTTLNSTNLQKSKLTVFPNPFTDQIQTSTPLFCELKDVFGRTIYRGSEIELQNFSDLNNGIYFLECEVDNQMQFIPIVKN